MSFPWVRAGSLDLSLYPTWNQMRSLNGSTGRQDNNREYRDCFAGGRCMRGYMGAGVRCLVSMGRAWRSRLWKFAVFGRRDCECGFMPVKATRRSVAPTRSRSSRAGE